jgi:hypothetical protein
MLCLIHFIILSSVKTLKYWNLQLIVVFSLMGMYLVYYIYIYLSMIVKSKRIKPGKKLYGEIIHISLIRINSSKTQ